MMIIINNRIKLLDSDVQISATTSQGPGGQNVNKVATAIQLRFDIPNSSLHAIYKSRLLKASDQRLTQDGVLIIKAQNHRSQEKNKFEAISRLRDFFTDTLHVPKHRKETKPTINSQKKRVDTKQKRGQTKSLRQKPRQDD